MLLELPSYTGAIAAFRNTRAVLVGVKQQPDGIDLDDLQEVLQRVRQEGRRVKFLYVTPNFQNPSGSLLSLEKRLRLLEWAGREGVPIVEDDPYGDLYFEDAATAAETRPIKADDRDDSVIYLTSFSKTLAPGVPYRLGRRARAGRREVRRREAGDRPLHRQLRSAHRLRSLPSAACSRGASRSCAATISTNAR